MLSFDEALSALLEIAPQLAPERVAIDEACGRVLAEELRAPFDVPLFDYSAMDGYAVSTSDLVGVPPWTLDVEGESKTGAPAPALAPRTACRIFTGAELPQGADAVVMQENVERTGRDGARATFVDRPKPGANIRRHGEDLAHGDIALTSGTLLRPSHLALAATLDRAWLEVSRRPIVAVLGTGDELRAPGSTGRPGTIPESNSVALKAMAQGVGAFARVLPFVTDDRAATERAVGEALRGTDVLVTVGGVSVGDHDLVRPALEKVGVALEFWKVAIKPGKPLAVGRRDGTLVLGLPGNPASAMVTFALFGLPLLRKMQGNREPLVRFARATLVKPIVRSPGRTEFLRAQVSRDGDVLSAAPLANQASGAVTSMAHANALIRIPADRASVAHGESVDILWLSDLGA